MATFRFRAAVVLDLRIRHEQAAQQALSHAEARVHEARRAQSAAEDQRGGAQQDLAALERRGSDVAAVLWHRNWIVRLAGEVELRRRDVESCTRKAREAERLWQEARRRRLALERMRERAWKRFQADEARRDQQAMDELARVRFVLSESPRSDP